MTECAGPLPQIDSHFLPIKEVLTRQKVAIESKMKSISSALLSVKCQYDQV